MTAMPKRKVVDQGRYIRNGQVVIGLAVVGREIEAILGRRRVALERGRGVVKRMLPGERVQQGEAAEKALFIANLQRIVVRPELVKSFSNVAGPVGIVSLDIAGAQFRENSLVGIDETLQFESMVAYIRDIAEGVL